MLVQKVKEFFLRVVGMPHRKQARPFARVQAIHLPLSLPSSPISDSSITSPGLMVVSLPNSPCSAQPIHAPNDHSEYTSPKYCPQVELQMSPSSQLPSGEASRPQQVQAHAVEGQLGRPTLYLRARSTPVRLLRSRSTRHRRRPALDAPLFPAARPGQGRGRGPHLRSSPGRTATGRRPRRGHRHSSNPGRVQGSVAAKVTSLRRSSPGE